MPVLTDHLVSPGHEVSAAIYAGSESSIHSATIAVLNDVRTKQEGEDAGPMATAGRTEVDLFSPFPDPRVRWLDSICKSHGNGKEKAMTTTKTQARIK